jgi:hypothetical protein
MASLLGTGVMLLAVAFWKAGFLTGTFDLDMESTPLASPLVLRTPVEELGVPLGAFEKKLRIDAFFDDPTLETCFFEDEGAGVPSDFSFFIVVAKDRNG